MENEIMEDILQEAPEDILETETDHPDVPPDVVPDEEIVEDVPPTSEDVSEDEIVGDSSALEEPEADLEEPDLEEDTDLQEGVEENETIVKLENGNDDFYNSVSGNDIMGSDSGSGADDSYITNFYTMETEEAVPLWENKISDFSTSEMLLFLIFLLLLVQFIHNIFKGSHWLKG